MSRFSRIGLDRLLPHRPSGADLKALMDEVEENNQLYKAILSQVMPGMSLKKDYQMKNYISDGFEKNADVFSIIDRLGTMFSQIIVESVVDDVPANDELNERIKLPNNYQVWGEWSKLWYIFYLVTGNGIIYAPRMRDGNNKGKLMPGGMYMMPTQHTEIISGGWRDPIKEYILDVDQTEQIPAEDVIHIRMPNLQYREGANFMGMSPLKVAALIIEAENQGYQTIADTLARGIPPGILTKVNADMDVTKTKEQQANLDRTYSEKYGNQKHHRTAGKPVITSGDLKWVQMGFSNFSDLQIIELNQNGLRVLCNVLNVPSVAFNDPSGAQHWNLRDSRKMVYTNRLIPDMDLLLEYLNVSISAAYGKSKLKADYSKISELQTDKKDMAQWMDVMGRWGYPPNKIFEKLGLETIDDPALDRSYLPFNLVSTDETITEAKARKILKDNDIDDYKHLNVV